MEEALAREAFAADDGCESGSLLAPVSSSGIFWIDVPDRAMDARCRAANEEPAHVDEPSVHQGPPPIPPPILRDLPPLAEPPVALLLEPPISNLIEPPVASEPLGANADTGNLRSEDDTLPPHRGRRSRRAIAALMLLAAALVCGNVWLWGVDGAPPDQDFVAVVGADAPERETASEGDAGEVADAVLDVEAVGDADSAERETASAVDAEEVADAVFDVDAAGDADSAERETAGDVDTAAFVNAIADVDVAVGGTARDAGVRPVASIVLPPQAAVCTSGTCGTDNDLAADRSLGTALTWADSVDEAAQRAQDEGKLVFLIHVSGNFELPGFT